MEPRVITRLNGGKKNIVSGTVKDSLVENKSDGAPADPRRLIIMAVIVVAIIGGAYVLLDYRGKGKNVSQNVLSLETSNATSPASPLISGAQLQVTSATDPVIAELVQTVFKHIFLPSGNVQISTVVKPDELRKVNPVFYQFAKEGDKVLIYADRAILYDPVADKVLDVIHGPSQPSK